MQYKIIRFTEGHPSRVTHIGLTLEQAQKHCRSPETSSSTCESPGIQVWFDGYEPMVKTDRPRSMLSKLAELQTV